MTAGLSAGPQLDTLQSAGAVPRQSRGTVTFVAGTTGAIAQHTIFTITGHIRFSMHWRCLTGLTSGGAATITIGNAGTVDALLGLVTATNVDAGEFGNTQGSDFSGTSANFVGSAPVAGSYESSGADITLDILSATITGGSIEYVLEWVPLSSGATVALGAELVAS